MSVTCDRSIVLAHWNNNPWCRHVATLAHHTLFWFCANPNLILLLSSVFLAEKQKHTNFIVFRLTHDLPHSIRTRITQPVRFTTTKVYHPTRMDFYTWHALHCMPFLCIVIITCFLHLTLFCNRDDITEILLKVALNTITLPTLHYSALSLIRVMR